MNKLLVATNPDIEELEIVQVDRLDKDLILSHAINNILFLWGNLHYGIYDKMYEIFFEFLLKNDITNTRKLKEALKSDLFRDWIKQSYGV